MIKIIFNSLLILLILVGCKNNKEKEISKIKLNYDFIEFHKSFYSANAKDIVELKLKYPYLFPSSVSDKEWLDKINDSNEQILFQITDSVYSNLTKIKKTITTLYQHITYYKPAFSPPKTFIIINGLDYENSTIYADSLAFISLDLYLGADSDVYADFPKYISSNFTENNITVDLAKSIIQKEFLIRRDRSFLGSMLYFGKQLYLTEQFLPNLEEQYILEIPKTKLIWSLQNEAQIWKYFISNDLLFSTNQKLNKRFIDLAPFSKFYMDSDKQSPGSIGKYIGLQIIRSYMINNPVTINTMLSTSTNEIFKRSRYKPSK